MNDKNYDKQRIEGSEGIVGNINKLADGLGITVSVCIWDGDEPMVDRDVHSLEVRVGKKTMTIKLSDKQLVDYPGRAGTEITDAALRALVQGMVDN